jgi:hypothetical protein
MYKKILLILPLLIGCTPNIVDRDFEKEEREYIKLHGELAKKDPLYGAPTPHKVESAREDGVVITLFKGKDVKEGGLQLQQWYAMVRNENDEPKCVNIAWKLMDFQMVTEYAEYIYLKPYEEKTDYAIMKQKVWELDGVRLVLPASGYVAAMDIKEPSEKNTCEFETEIEEK